MLCKKCGKLVEPQYEPNGECENCFADTCDNITDVYKDKPIPDTMSEKEILELPISDLDLTEMTENRLSLRDIIFVKDLVTRTETELRNMPMIGDKTLIEIKERLQELNLALKEEDPSLVLSLQS